MGLKHIFVASRDDSEMVRADEDSSFYWSVPKDAQLGEKGFLLLPEGLGFYAVVEIVSPPQPDDRYKKYTGHGAEIEIVHLLNPCVPLKECQAEFRTWLNLQHPTVWNRSFTISPAQQYFDFLDFLKKKQESIKDRMDLEQALR